MFTKEMTEEIIEECWSWIEKFDDEHNGRARGKSVKVCLNGIDGGGMSTYGKSVLIASTDEYECRNGYLFIHGRSEKHNSRCDSRTRCEKTVFVPYESIIAIECCPEVIV